MALSSEFLAVPGEVSSSAAEVWLGTTSSTVDRSGDIAIVHRASGMTWKAGAWNRWNVPGDPAAAIHHQRVTLDGLQPSTLYPLDLIVSGQTKASASIRTLPDSLPSVDQPPFIVFLGSCFCRSQDKSGQAGRAFMQMPAGARPHVKCLVGDQVYLDSPWYRFTLPQSISSLSRGFLDQYLSTWGQTGDVQGFNQLLSAGANYFCPDDHEFWNNAPFPSSFAVNTWMEGDRRHWWQNAQTLFAAFQSARTPTTFSVGQLNVLVLDTRTYRTADRKGFLRTADVAFLRNWINRLESPGVIVVGQPIFATKAGFAGHFADWNFPDFDQYTELCQILLSSSQSILVLTGDVHYGRLASAPLPSGGELVELISSPMALVDRSAGGHWNAAPERFPAVPIPGIKSVPVTTEGTWKRFANHFVTLEFTQAGGGIRVRTRSWETESAGGQGMLVADRLLKKVMP